MTIHNILMLVDDMACFEKFDIPQDKGGCLYVPGGEKIAEPAARFIGHLTNATIILPQDFHPKNHISFMENHPGVMADRKNRLRDKGHPENKLDALALDVMTMPFDNILLGKNVRGLFEAVAFEVGDKFYGVNVNACGYITGIRSIPANPELLVGAIPQTLWRMHAVQGTESGLLAKAIMDILPQELREDILNPNRLDPVLTATDAWQNAIWVARKGMRRDMDSYGVATENDKISTTEAPKIFSLIAENLKQKGITEANIYIGGLATNFCVEYSHADIYEFLVPALNKNGIKASVYLLTDICAGIPLSIPNGSWPDLATAPQRMASKGTIITTSDDVIRSILAGRGNLKSKPPEANA